MAVTHKQASTSTEFVRIGVTATEDGVPVNVSTSGVMVLFQTEGADPPAQADVDWSAAAWEIDATTVPDTYYARVLVGPSPGVVQLAAGVWQPWVKIIDAPEVTVREADGEVQIT